MIDVNSVIALLRGYILEDIQIKVLLDDKPAMYLIEKPKDEEVENYIIYLYKPLGGRIIQDCQVEFRLVGKDLAKLIALKSRLIKLLNYTRDSEVIRFENTIIQDAKLLTGGGQIKNPATDNYELVVYFLLKY